MANGVPDDATPARPPARRDYLAMDGDGGVDEELELEFELDAIAAMSVADRYDAAIRLSLMMIEMMERHGHREPSTVLERPIG